MRLPIQWPTLLARLCGWLGARVATASTIARPFGNRGNASSTRANAQRAIEADGLSDRADTLGDYLEAWTERPQRAERTDATYNHRISRVAEVEVEGILSGTRRSTSSAVATPSPWSTIC